MTAVENVNDPSGSASLQQTESASNPPLDGQDSGKYLLFCFLPLPSLQNLLQDQSFPLEWKWKLHRWQFKCQFERP